MTSHQFSNPLSWSISGAILAAFKIFIPLIPSGMGKFHTPYHFARLIFLRKGKFSHPLFLLGRENFHTPYNFPGYFQTPYNFPGYFHTPYIFTPLMISREIFIHLKLLAKYFTPLKKYSNRVSELKYDPPLITPMDSYFFLNTML